MSAKRKSEQVVTPTNPQWITDMGQTRVGNIAELDKIDPYSLVPGSNPLLDRAASKALGLGANDGWFGEAADAARRQLQGGGGGGGVTAASLLDNLDAYISPYTKHVVDAALGDFDMEAGRTRAANRLQEARTGAFGGSGASLTRSMTDDSLARGRASLDAGLRDKAFNTGAALSGQDADRRQSASVANAQLGEQAAARALQAAGLLGNLAGASGESARADIGVQGQLGEFFRNVDRERLMAPFTKEQIQSGLFSQFPAGLFHGQKTNTTETTSDPVGQIGKLIATIGAIAAAPATGGLSLAGLGAAAAKGIQTKGF